MSEYQCNRLKAKFQFCAKYLSLKFNNRFLYRFFVIVTITSLLMPTFLLGDWVKSVSAFQSSLTISVPPTSAPNVAPPVPY